MTSDALSRICPEDKDRHRYFWHSSLAALKDNLEAGCQVCSLLYHALGSFHGSWLKESRDVNFRLILSNKFSLRIDVDQDAKGTRDTMNILECVYEERSLVAENHSVPSRSLKPLKGIYSSLNIFPGRKVPHLPENNTELMRSWIQRCRAEHPNCRSGSDPSLPTRVVDVGLSPDSIVRLYETNGERGDYTALSHRWGKDILLTTTKGTIEARKQVIEWSSLSKTFQDAASLTRLLGLRYLWIDSLCIVQDDATDWETESSKMAAIYENSYVTISANNSTGVLLGPTARVEAHNSQVKAVDPDGSNYTIIARSPLPHDMFYATSLEGVLDGWERDYPLSKRAWCFQERLLASRILHFTEHEVIFECKTCCECECGGIGIGDQVTLKSVYADIAQARFAPGTVLSTPWDGWKMIVSPYTQKHITYPIDVLPALAGLASRMQQERLGRYIAGLWEKELAQGLFWFADVVSILKNPVKTAPTFSWASLAGTSKVRELQWPWFSAVVSESSLKQIFSIVEVQCRVQELSPYGTVSDVFVKLHGYMTAIKLETSQVRRGFNCIVRSKGGKQFATAFLDRHRIADIKSETCFVCFLGFTWWYDSKRGPETKKKLCALILQLVETDVYERVGCLPLLDDDPVWLEHSEEKVITII